MKVLYIDVNCKFGSTGQIVYSLFSECKKNAIEAAVCYGRGPMIKEASIYKFGLDIETYLHAFLTRITGYTGCFSFFSTRRLINYIKNFNPDIVHIHELHAYFVNIKPLLKFLRNNNIPTIFTNHCEFLYTGKCGHSKDCDKYSDKCGNCPLLKIYPASLFFDKTSKMLSDKKKLLLGWKNTYYVSPSRWLDSKMDISFLKDNKRHVINNGIDTSIYSVSISNLRNGLNIPKDNKIVITAAPNLFSINKGGYRFLEIAKHLKNEEITFIAIGANDSEKIERDNNVIIVPLIKDKKRLCEYYSLADCFVICSQFENFPTTSLEAQCCGTKVVGYDVGGVKETILDGNGEVVQFNDVEAISKTILQIINDNYSKEEVSNKAKQYYSQERMFKDYLELYNKLSRSKKGRKDA